MKNEKKNLRVLRPVLIISVITAIVCLSGIVFELYKESRNRAYYVALSDAAQPDTAEETEIRPDGEQNDKPVNEHGERDAESIPQTTVQSVDFEALRKTAPDAVAWISCQGTVIDYPVVSGTDNEYYLTHLPDGTGNAIGSIFMDFRNSKVFSDRNTAIYGHHTRAGDMFGTLDNYKEQQYYDKYPVFRLAAPEHTYLLELVAGYLLDASYETIPLTFKDDDDFMKHIDNIRKKSLFKSDVNINPDSRIVSLCTCSYDYSDSRLVIVAKLTEAEGDADSR